MRWAVAILLLYLTSCSKGGQHELGQYVYVDCFHTIHIDRNCASELSDNPRTKEERMVNMQGISFIDTCALSSSWNPYNAYKFCPKCVDDDAFRHLSNIMKRNEIKPPGY